MFDHILKFSLRNRLPVIAFALFLTVYGLWHIQGMVIDVFPNLNRPRVVVITEAHGMSTEEVETLITLPRETAFNGANHVIAVRSSSAVGISVVYVEFDWESDILEDRQIVNERLQLVSERLPEGVQPVLAPISSIMGQIQMIGIGMQGARGGAGDLTSRAHWADRGLHRDRGGTIK